MNNLLILTIGVFSIINTEMGVIGILPLISSSYGIPVQYIDILLTTDGKEFEILGEKYKVIYKTSSDTYNLFEYIEKETRVGDYLLVLAKFHIQSIRTDFDIGLLKDEYTFKSEIGTTYKLKSVGEEYDNPF